MLNLTQKKDDTRRAKIIDGNVRLKGGEIQFLHTRVIKAWIDRAIKDPRTIHHRGRGAFMVVGETIKLPSKMK